MVHYSERCQWLNSSWANHTVCVQQMEKAFLKTFWFRQIKYGWNQGVSGVLSWGKRLIRLLLEVFSTLSMVKLCSLIGLLISDTSGFLKCRCRNCWRNLGFCLVHRLPLAVPFISCSPSGASFPPLSFQTPITRGSYVPFVLLKCSCVCSLSVKQMSARWPALVSPDSYIANQISFSSINDKDLHDYKNLRNLWVLSACLHTHITEFEICSGHTFKDEQTSTETLRYRLIIQMASYSLLIDQ